GVRRLAQSRLDVATLRGAGAPGPAPVPLPGLQCPGGAVGRGEAPALHDGVTGLPNRSYLEQRAGDVLAHRAMGEDTDEVAVIFLDLDGFTAVNDSAGHVRGDHLLGQAARRLRAELDSSSTLARWGGDEFAVLVEGSARAQQVVDLAERLGRAIASEPFQVADRDILLTAGIGVAFAESTIDSGELLRNADVAMTRAKKRGP